MEQEKSSKKAAVVTGASSGIGLEISRTICKLGYEVFGFGRNFERKEYLKTEFDGGRFHPVVCDLLDTELLSRKLREITQEYEVCILVNNAGVGYYGLHEEVNTKKIQEMVRINLEVPMVLTQMLLRQLKKNRGYVINISSVTAEKSNPHGCAYGATKAALLNFSRSLFDEARKYGVKVTVIKPDMTQTNLYRNADFKEGDEEESYLKPQEVSGAVEYILSQRDGMTISEITLQPQIHRIKRKDKNEH